MSELTERLRERATKEDDATRAGAEFDPWSARLLREAADEVDRLKALAGFLQDGVAKLQRSLDEMTDRAVRTERDLAACRDTLKVTGTDEEGRLRRKIERLTARAEAAERRLIVMGDAVAKAIGIRDEWAAKAGAAEAERDKLRRQIVSASLTTDGNALMALEAMADECSAAMANVPPTPDHIEPTRFAWTPSGSKAREAFREFAASAGGGGVQAVPCEATAPPMDAAETVLSAMLWHALKAISEDDALECRCGADPYTDGEQCPRCFALTMVQQTESRVREVEERAMALGSAAPSAPSRLPTIVAEQIRWARDRLVDAERDENRLDAEAWHGYIQGLQWVAEALVRPELMTVLPASEEIKP